MSEYKCVREREKHIGEDRDRSLREKNEHAKITVDPTDTTSTFGETTR